MADRTRPVPAHWDKFRRHHLVRKMKDYQRYWYWALCMEGQFTNRPGYLPNDMTLLYELADCSASRKFFEGNFGCVRECFKVTEDGRWLYHDTALEIAEAIQEKSQQARCNRTSVERPLNVRQTGDIEILISKDFSFSIYNDYPKKVGRKAALLAIDRAIKRFVKEEKCSAIDAAQTIHSRVIEFAKSPSGNAGKFTPHPATWFNQDRYLDDPKQWSSTGGRNASEVAGSDEF